MNASMRGLHGSAADGLGDPERPTTAEHLTESTERLAEDAERARSRSPLLAALRRVAWRAKTPTRLGR